VDGNDDNDEDCPVDKLDDEEDDRDDEDDEALLTIRVSVDASVPNAPVSYSRVRNAKACVPMFVGEGVHCKQYMLTVMGVEPKYPV
jgi:hypothetical protein